MRQKNNYKTYFKIFHNETNKETIIGWQQTKKNKINIKSKI